MVEEKKSIEQEELEALVERTLKDHKIIFKSLDKR